MLSELDEVVINIIGYSAENDELYGIANDRRSYLVSQDYGATWWSISKQRYL